MGPRTFIIETHGCQMNEHDSEKIAGLLAHRGLRAVSAVEEADLFILNTCSVREKAAHRVYSRLGQLRPRKQRDPDFLIGVVGCVAQQESEEMVNKAPHVDLVVGTHLYHSIPDLLDEISARQKTDQTSSRTVSTRFLPEPTPPEIGFVQRATEFRANVTIMEGCNKQCAFCIVPYTRGRERSRPAQRILEEIRQVADQGHVEVLLLGQTVNSYKDTSQSGYKFARLLHDVAQIGGIRRIRFTSPHPRHFSDEVIDVIAGHSNICDHVHLPLQSGSSKVLRLMRRQHDRRWYLDLVDRFRSCGRHIALSTDIIVGFPGEAEKDFEDTLDIVMQVGYESMFSFKYSPRPGTQAWDWPDSVPDGEKQRRLAQLQRLQRDLQLQLHQQRYLNRSWEVLVEGPARDRRQLFGRTTTNKVVNFGGDDLPGTFAKVHIRQAGPNSFVGEKVQTASLLS